MAAASISELLQPIQIRRRELEDKASTVWEVLQNGSQRAQLAAEEVMKDVRAVTGLSRDLSGIRVEALLSTTLKTKDAHDLSHLDAWWDTEPNVMTRNLRTVWRQDIAGSHVALKPEAEGVWITRNNRRVYVAAAREELNEHNEPVWRFFVKPKSYEILVLLCWDRARILHDFIVPQKLFIGQWAVAKRAAGKADIQFFATLKDGRYQMVMDFAPAIDITDTESTYAVIGD